jgi:hypothetical protein
MQLGVMAAFSSWCSRLSPSCACSSVFTQQKNDDEFTRGNFLWLLLFIGQGIIAFLMGLL